MADYTDNEAAGEALVQSKSATASLSLADAIYKGGKQHDVNQLRIPVVAMNIIVGIVAIATVGVALVAMYLEGSVLVYLSFAISLILAPYVVYQRSRVQWLPST
jgi:hypothetical protein